MASKLRLTILFFFSTLKVFAQCPDVLFSINDVCQYENLNIINNSTGSFEWDFCVGDLESDPTLSDVFSVNSPFNSNFVKHNNEWFGFVPSGNKLMRLEFGASIRNPPTSSNLGNIGGNWNTIIDLELFHENENLYGLVIDFGSSKLFRLEFGNSAYNIPTVIDLGGFSDISSPLSIELIIEGQNKYALIGQLDGSVIQMNFGNSILNSPNTKKFTILGGNRINDFALIKHCGTWHGWFSTFSTNKLVKTTFENGIFSQPNLQEEITTSASQTLGIEAVEDGDNLAVFVGDFSSNRSFIKLNYGNNIENTPTEHDYGNLFSSGSLWGIEFVKDASNWQSFVVNRAANKLQRLDFDINCSINEPISFSKSPNGFFYENSGVYSIALKVTDENHNYRTMVETIQVSNARSPLISFSVDNSRCISNSNTFTSHVSEGFANSFSWDFNEDGVEDSNEPNPSFQFITPGTKQIELSVQSNNGCFNNTKQEISIYSQPPTPDFEINSQSLCSNSNLLFNNLTNESQHPSNVITYSWDFNGEGVSDLKSPTFSFSSSGTKQITLTASIPGCETFISKNINLLSGPTVDFDWTNNCFGETIEFNNLSTDGLEIGYTWDFGDSSPQSSLQNPTHVYQNTGTYTITLTVDDGSCTNVLSKELLVNDQSLASMDFGESIENVPTYLKGIDLSNNQDSVVEWNWLVDGLSISQEQNTSYSFTKPGEYIIRLEVITEQGCSDFVEMAISVIESKCPIAELEIPKKEVCVGEFVTINNQSINSFSQKWDFCSGETQNIPIAHDLVSQSFGDPLSFKLVGGINNQWYGFLLSSNKLFRLNFGTDIHSLPQVFELGKLSDDWVSPIDFEITEENGNWYGFLVDTETSNMFRLDFETSLENVPRIVNLGNLEVLNFPLSIEIVENLDEKYVFVGNRNSLLVQLDFGSSILSTPAKTTSIINGGNRLADFSFIRDCDIWYGWTTSFVEGKVFQMEFGEGLGSTPSDIKTIETELTRPLGIEAIRDGEFVSLFIQNNSTEVGSLERKDFLNGLNQNPSTVSLGDLGVFSQNWILSFAQVGSTWLGFSPNRADGHVYMLDFMENCTSSSETYHDRIPDSIFYSQPGTYIINLIAHHQNGGISSDVDTITVLNLSSPEISFSTTNQCLANTNTFTAIDNGGIDTYSWDFDNDGIEDANEQNPSYQFESIGTQDVQLVVQSSNGCFNNVSQEVVIYPEPPVPDFEITNTLICSNTELFFSNLSDESAHNDEVLSYTWDFDGEQTSTEKNTNYTFNTGGTKQVSLTMAIPGCESFISKNIEIDSGPGVAFEFNDECEGAEVPFINQTTGEGITDYQWNFGDGFTSTSVNPSHAYDAAGNYDITLTSSNDMGCENSITQTITTHSIPVVSFINEVGCQNIPLQFTDQSLADNANITAWSWDFAGLGTSGEQNPQFTFSEAGEYSISLSAETNFGCREAISQTVSIAASPLVDFDVTEGCLNETTSFTDLTPTQQNNPITSWFWEIDGQVFTTQNPEYTFENPGEYEISLTVTPENNCAIKLTKSIFIESLPVVDFSVNHTCDNEFTIFSDLSTVDTTPIISRTWDLGGLATANGPSAAFNFPQAGTYDITLTILNEKGCTNQTTKTIEIFGSPKAALEADVNFGAPPLEVNFLNKSIGANFYSWDFDDPSNSVSTDKDPGFTFNEVNDYRVRLIAGNELGCSDTTYTTIVSSIPTLDLQLVKMEPSLNNGKINLTLTILNSGTIKIEGFDIVVGIENDFSISESFTGALNAAEQITYTLNFEIPATGSNINYLCIKLEDRLSSTTDNNPLNNEKCTNFGQLVIIENPFPNPAIDQVGFKLILPSTSNVDLSMVNIHGKTVYRQSFSNLSSGLNNFSIDLQNFERGMYFLKINTHSKEEIKRIIKF